jgi:sulfur transfer complex TusBCD TusB component (DsrH family)
MLEMEQIEEITERAKQMRLSEITADNEYSDDDSVVLPEDSVSNVSVESEESETLESSVVVSSIPEKLIKRGIVYKMKSSNELVYIGSTSLTINKRFFVIVLK